MIKPFHQEETVAIYQGDALSILQTLPGESVQCCVTSPPYWGLRDYGVAGQIGLEPTIEEYVAKMVKVFAEVRRVLRPEPDPTGQPQAERPLWGALARRPALQADGWYLRSEITWCKTSPMPESVTDRPTSATEKIFLLTKSAKYFYNAEAARVLSVKGAAGSRFDVGKTGAHQLGRAQVGERKENGTRNLWNYWILGPEPFKGAHFAVFPTELVRRCIAAGSKEGDTILDPFAGAGTTGLVASKMFRGAVLIELNQEYCTMAVKRLSQGVLNFGKVAANG